MPEARSSRSPWKVRRIPLEGREVGEWFRLRGWTVVGGDSESSHAFVDEAFVGDVTVRRVWHTALTLSLSAPRTQAGSEGDTLIIHVAGSGVIDLGNRGSTPLGANDVIFVPHHVGLMYRSDEPLARIEVDHVTRARSDEMFHADSDLISSVLITSAVNALFHAHDSRGQSGFIAAPAVAAALKALTSAVRTEASHSPSSRMRSRPAEVSNEELYQQARTILEAEAVRHDLSIDAIAGRLGTGRRRLERAFQAHGESPIEVLRSHRLRLARTLVESQRDLEMTEIAYRTGFPSGRAVKTALKKHGVRLPPQH
ncbi:helix-turn-helix domain-containing protein [Microbacterium sp. SLBN-111]|uniref:helix-turn-helix domain-containing protein n=1 Tax=Microbacterium sp. SLBN-111 TaxID=3377733 RepID=UPI003C734802